MYNIDGCFVSIEHNICLIHIYKNASIAIRNSFNMRGKYHKYVDIKDQNLTTITIIREPISRIISIYQYMLRDEDYGFPVQHNPEKIRKMDFYIQRDDIIKSFNSFLNELEISFFSAVSLPQTTFLEHRNIKIDDFDYVLLQETIDDDFKKFTDQYEIKGVTLVNSNCSDKSISFLLNNYVENNKDIQDKIKRLYHSDFELYEHVKNK
jgi:hypothetical protein